LSPIGNRSLLRLALIGALAASLGLGACGRKGPLDPPPGASLEGEPQPNVAPGLISTNRGTPKPIGSQSTPENPGVDENGQPLAPKGPRKNIPLDVLLN
jgi:predicted small lipoprotein YifL